MGRSSFGWSNRAAEEVVAEAASFVKARSGDVVHEIGDSRISVELERAQEGFDILFDMAEHVLRGCIGLVRRSTGNAGKDDPPCRVVAGLVSMSSGRFLRPHFERGRVVEIRTARRRGFPSENRRAGRI